MYWNKILIAICILDKWTPHAKARWFAAFSLIALFLIRIITTQGWYIVTYALGIYHLNLFIAFLTPKIDPSMDLDGKFKSHNFRNTKIRHTFLIIIVCDFFLLLL